MANTDDKDKTLTTRQGHPVSNNQSQRTVGSRGPATLENYHFIEKPRSRARRMKRSVCTSLSS